MQIHQQRAERENLERLVSRAGFDEPVDRIEHCEILKLWRTARRNPANARLECGSSIHLITSGWAGWVRQAGSGKVPIFLFLMPGDFIVPGLSSAGCCELVSLTSLRSVDASSLIRDDAGQTPRSASIIDQSGSYYRRLLVDHMTRLAIGCTTQAVAHLLHEFYLRSERAGACSQGRFGLPIGQRILGRSLGRSAVQINKVIRSLQAGGIIKVGYDWIEVVYPVELERLAGFPHGISTPGGTALQPTGTGVAP